MSNAKITFYAVGDIGPSRDDPHSMFRHCRDTLAQADLVFAQLEPCLTTRGTPLPQARLAMRTDPSAAAAFKAAGINVVSFASNHCMDWGREAFADTLEALGDQGLTVIGAGRNIAEARKPALSTINDTDIAMLAYNAILPQGYWAEEQRPGCAPMRAFTVHEQIEHDQPGTPARTHTFPHRQDLQTMVADIEAAKARADIVIVSMHWGLHFIPGQIAGYQQTVAHAAVDAGADLMVGHHPHILKGIEVYRGKVIFYSLGNFAIESPTAFKEGLSKSEQFSEIKALNDNWVERKKILLPEDSLKTCIAKCIIKDKTIQGVSLLPCHINDDAEPEVLTTNDPRHREVVDYLQTISRDHGLNAVLEQCGDEVTVEC